MERKYTLIFIFLLISQVFVRPSALSAEGKKIICIYEDERGRVRQVDSVNDIPDAFRKSSQCGELPESADLRRPEEIELEGRTGEREISTALGKMRVRWSRKVQSLFNRTPERAVADAASAVSKTVRKSGFPTWLASRLNELPWSIVFINEELPETQIPKNLIDNCHPGWMTPPANIYVVSQRVVAGCGSRQGGVRSISQAQLARLLIHEMAHVVEFQIVDPRNNNDKMRAEGFASWFEQIASDFSSNIKDGVVSDDYKSLEALSIAQNPDNFQFQGSAEDYARAASYFRAIVNRNGIFGISKVYDSLGKTNGDFFKAINHALGWDRKRLGEEAKKSLKR